MTPDHPHSGGSYTRQPDGSLIREGAAPAVPEDDAPAKAPAKPAKKDA